MRWRGTDDEKSLQKRLGKARFELTKAKHFDHILINDSLEKALAEAEAIVKEFLAL